MFIKECVLAVKDCRRASKNASICVLYEYIHRTDFSTFIILYDNYLLPIPAGSFLGPFAKLRKATITFFMSVCLSVRMEQLNSHSTDCREI
jgi:hypothetical protein